MKLKLTIRFRAQHERSIKKKEKKMNLGSCKGYELIFNQDV
jgi:hypothetical protein